MWHNMFYYNHAIRAYLIHFFSLSSKSDKHMNVVPPRINYSLVSFISIHYIETNFNDMIQGNLFLVTVLFFLTLISTNLQVAQSRVIPITENHPHPIQRQETASAKHNPTDASFSEIDIPGLYSLVGGNSTCSRGIRLHDKLSGTQVQGTFELPHSSIEEDGHTCIGDGSTVIVISTSINQQKLERQQQPALITALDKQGSPFAIAVDRMQRICGRSLTPALSMSVFAKPKNVIVVDKSIVLHPFVTYLIMYKTGVTDPCVYVRTSENESDEETDTGMNNDALPTTQIVAETDGKEINEQPMVSASYSPELHVEEDQVFWEEENDGMLNYPTIDPEPSISPSEEGEQTAACFPASALVSLPDGSEKRIDEIRIGDEVQTGDGSVTKVYAFSHRDFSTVSNNFIRLSTDIGNCSLTLTEGHYVYVNDKLLPAEQVTIGHAVMCRGQQKVTVTKVEKAIHAMGLFNIHTMSGDVVVDGVKVSTFTTAVEVMAASAMLTPVRAAFKVLEGAIGNGRMFMFDAGRDFFLKIAPRIAS